MTDENEHHQSIHSVDNASEDQVAWMNQQGSGENESMTSGSDDYMVMSIKKINVMELKIPGARVQVEVSGKKMWLWVDRVSPVTIFSMTDLKDTLGKTNIQLQPSQEEFLDYKNNRIHMLGKVALTMALNGWAAPAQVSVISGNHHSILERSDGYPRFGVGATKESDGNHGEGSSQEEEEYDELQT